MRQHDLAQVTDAAFPAEDRRSACYSRPIDDQPGCSSIGPAVEAYTATHPMNAGLRRKQEIAKPIEIGSDVWVGGGAIICPGVRIGSRSVIGAGSVVTHDVPDKVFAAGNPCKVIPEITES
jgi:acetyltransferase-like isoleucine patch superfamily enzyme